MYHTVGIYKAIHTAVLMAGIIMQNTQFPQYLTFRNSDYPI